MFANTEPELPVNLLLQFLSPRSLHLSIERTKAHTHTLPRLVQKQPAQIKMVVKDFLLFNSFFFFAIWLYRHSFHMLAYIFSLHLANSSTAMLFACSFDFFVTNPCTLQYLDLLEEQIAIINTTNQAHLTLNKINNAFFLFLLFFQFSAADFLPIWWSPTTRLFNHSTCL